MNKKIIVIAAIVVVLGVFTLFSTKVVKTGEEGKLTGKQEFDVTSNVADMWDKAEADIEGRAVELKDFFKEANGDLKSLADKYGKYSMGDKGAISYPVKGTGTIEEVENSKKAGYMVLKVDGYDGDVIVKMQIGSIYKGSSTRDCLTIVNFGDYTNQQEWAAVSQELHAKIDENVIKPADPANLKGKQVEFVGTFTAENDKEILVTPVKLTVK